MDDRGEYRTIHVAMLDDGDYLALSADAKQVLLVLKMILGRTGIDTVRPGTLEWYTGRTATEVAAALDELKQPQGDKGPWIEEEKCVIWLRNGLRYEVGQNMRNANHATGLRMQIQRLPRYEIVRRWCGYYRFAVPGVATPKDVQDMAHTLIAEIYGDKYADTDITGDGIVYVGDQETEDPRRSIPRNGAATIHDLIAPTAGDTIPDTMLDTIGDTADDAEPTASDTQKQKQKPIQKQKQNTKKRAPGAARVFTFSEQDMQCAVFLSAQIETVAPGYTARMGVNIESWAEQFRLIRMADKRALEDVAFVLGAFVNDEFWSQTIRSPAMLRHKTKGGEDRFNHILRKLRDPHGRHNHVAKRDEFERAANRYRPAHADTPRPDVDRGADPVFIPEPTFGL